MKKVYILLNLMTLETMMDESGKVITFDTEEEARDFASVVTDIVRVIDVYYREG